MNSESNTGGEPDKRNSIMIYIDRHFLLTK
jgi:hypothetical protein